MDPIQAAEYVAEELVKEKAILVILSGSAARGKEKPDDLDIAAVFKPGNSLLNRQDRTDLLQRLGSVKYRIHLFDFSEAHIDELIDLAIRDLGLLCFNLNFICLDSVLNQWKGWPLAWIYGEKAREMLLPYGCFQDQFMVLEGQEYLDSLRRKIKL